MSLASLQHGSNDESKRKRKPPDDLHETQVFLCSPFEHPHSETDILLLSSLPGRAESLSSLVRVLKDLGNVVSLGVAFEKQHFEVCSGANGMG
jgi:hypothetical protein